MSTTTANTTAPLTDREQAAVLHLASLPALTLLTCDKFEQGYQTGRARRYTNSLRLERVVPIIQAVGEKTVYELVLDGGPENDELLRELLECGPFTAVWPPVVVATEAASALPVPSSYAEHYRGLLDALEHAGIPGARFLTTGSGCYVVHIGLGDGGLVQIGSDAGPLGQPGEPGRTLEAVWYQSWDATGGHGHQLGSADPSDEHAIADLIQRIVMLVDAAPRIGDR